MANIINSDEFAGKIYEKLKPSGWNTALRTFIKSSDFTEILNSLQEEVKLNKRFTPTFKYILQPFELCNYEDVKVVLLAESPYKEINHSDGLAFSCSRLKKPQSSLSKLHYGINNTVKNSLASSNDLSYLAKQGVLLLNTSLTTEIGRTDTHRKHWKPFIANLLDHLQYNKPELVYLMLGEKAQYWEDTIEDSNKVVRASYPAQEDYAKQYTWDCENCFNKVNEILASQELPGIDW